MALWVRHTLKCLPYVVEGGRGQTWPLKFFLQMDSIVNWKNQKFLFISPHGHFLQPNLYHRTTFQFFSNDILFGMHLVPKIQRPIFFWTYFGTDFGTHFYTEFFNGFLNGFLHWISEGFWNKFWNSFQNRFLNVFFNVFMNRFPKDS